MLGPRDSLDPAPRRIIVGGPSGSGKTTLARRIQARTGLPHTELDALFHGPGWTERPTFCADAEVLTAGERWVTEWQYTGELGPLLPSRADTLVWIDLPVAVQMSRLIRRTVVRRIRRTELWNGNVEPPLRTFLTDREHVVRWGWRTRRSYAGRVAQAAADHPHLRIVRLRSSRETDLWLRNLPRSSSVRPWL